MEWLTVAAIGTSRYNTAKSKDAIHIFTLAEEAHFLIKVAIQAGTELLGCIYTFLWNCIVTLVTLQYQCKKGLISV